MKVENLNRTQNSQQKTSMRNILELNHIWERKPSHQRLRWPALEQAVPRQPQHHGTHGTTASHGTHNTHGTTAGITDRGSIALVYKLKTQL